MPDDKIDLQTFQQVLSLAKDFQDKLIATQDKVENNIKNIEAIRTEMRDATRELRDAKAIYDSSWKCFLANHWWKGALLLIIFFIGAYFLIEGKKLETTTPDGFTNKIEDLRAPKE